MLLASLVTSPARGDLSETLDRIYEREALQRELVSDDFRGFERFAEWLREYGAPLGYIVLTLGVTTLLILAVHILESRKFSFLKERGSASGASEHGVADDAGLISLSALLERADALANKGYFAEAIHELLLGALDHLKRDLRLNWQPAQTAREIIATQGRSDQGLARLVKTTEELYFGGVAGSDEVYRSCRAALPGILNGYALQQAGH